MRICETNPFANVAFYVEDFERKRVSVCRAIFANGFVFPERGELPSRGERAGRPFYGVCSS